MLDFINRNLLILFGCQMIFTTGTVLLVTIGGIVGYELAPNPSIATLPVALMVVGTALATIPAALTMQRIGRRLGFMLAALIAGGGAGIAIVSLAQESFPLFCIATGLVGSSLGFSQQFRFAGAESVAPTKVSNAVSFILLGSIAGAFLGPELVKVSAAADEQSPYTLAFTLVIGLYALALVVLAGFKKVEAATTTVVADHARPLKIVALQPVFIVAVMAGVVGQGVMTYVMTATPISMNVDEGISIQATSEVIRAHVIAMYLPSLITPLLIAKLGLTRLMIVGVAVMSGTLAIGLAGHHVMHYWFALVLLGIGWNFLFVGGTTMLVRTYRDSERFRAQAVNDFSVFGMSALASLLAGTMLHNLGWTLLLLSTIPTLVLMLAALLWLQRSRGLEQLA